MKRALTMMILLACAVGAQAAERIEASHPELLQSAKVIETAPALQEWLNFYYLHPRPDLARSAFSLMNENKLLSREDMRPGIISFLAAVLHGNPEVGMPLVADVNNPDERYVLAHAAWLSNTEAATDILDALGKGASDAEKAYLKEMTYRTAPELATRPIKTEWDLDALWATFFATGDKKYVQLVASTVGWSSNGDPVLRSIGEEARRTLVMNGSVHPRVLTVCEEELSRATNPQKEALAAVLSEAREEANRTH